MAGIGRRPGRASGERGRLSRWSRDRRPRPGRAHCQLARPVGQRAFDQRVPKGRPRCRGRRRGGRQRGRTAERGTRGRTLEHAKGVAIPATAKHDVVNGRQAGKVRCRSKYGCFIAREDLRVFSDHPVVTGESRTGERGRPIAQVSTTSRPLQAAPGARYAVNGRRRSLREVASELEAAGHTSKGKRYTATAVARMVAA